MASTSTPEYEASLLITLHGARGLPKADLIGTSDPFAVLNFPARSVLLGQSQPFGTFKTQTIDETINPEWSKSITLLMKSHVMDIPVEVYDEDPTKNDLLGKVLIPIDKTKPFQMITGWYALDSANKIDKSEVHVSYLYLPFDLAETLAKKAEEVNEEINASRAPQLSIIRARYRAFDNVDKGAEVTPIVAKAVTDNVNLNFKVDNKTLGGDPVRGKVKILDIWFTRRAGGPVETFEVMEEEVCRISV